MRFKFKLAPACLCSALKGVKWKAAHHHHDASALDSRTASEDLKCFNSIVAPGRKKSEAERAATHAMKTPFKLQIRIQLEAGVQVERV